MKRILIIDDDPLTAQLYRGFLERNGFEVQVANNGQTGFDRLIDFRPDGVLLDLMLPQINGADLLMKIRTTPGFEKMPVIGFTNAFVPALVQQMEAAGAHQVFDKATLNPSLLTTAFNSAFAEARKA